MLVKSGIDYSDKGKMHEQTKTSLKKFKGYSMGSTSHDLNAAIKVEPVFHTSTRGRYLHTRGCPWYRARCANRGGVSVSASAPVATISGKYPGNEHFRGRGRSQRPLNPPGLDGKLLRCSACGSYRHLIKNCPDTWENSTSTNLPNWWHQWLPRLTLSWQLEKCCIHDRGIQWWTFTYPWHHWRFMLVHWSQSPWPLGIIHWSYELRCVG